MIARPCLASLLALSLACSTGETGTSNGELARGAQSVPIIQASAVTYAETMVASGGTIAGTIRVDGAAPAVRVSRVTSDEAVCADGANDEATDADGRVGNAVVWLEGVSAGKRRSRIRRYELSQQRCALEPRVQAVDAPGTINVHNHDPVAHRTRFVARPAGTVLSVVREVDAGQVVPEERVAARAGLVEVRCELHPWTQGWVAVFDHPYHTVTGNDGAFTIDEIPPGTYTLVVWHERGERTARQVTVAAGQTLSEDIRIRLR